jgi:hypothetical protein
MTSFIDEVRKRRVWERGHPIEGFDPTVWRHDDFGSVIRYEDYGARDADFGWEIDHILPNALGGPDAIANLRPLHCRRNAALGGILGGLLG